MYLRRQACSGRFPSVEVEPSLGMRIGGHAGDTPRLGLVSTGGQGSTREPDKPGQLQVLRSPLGQLPRLSPGLYLQGNIRVGDKAPLAPLAASTASFRLGELLTLKVGPLPGGPGEALPTVKALEGEVLKPF